MATRPVGGVAVPAFGHGHIIGIPGYARWRWAGRTARTRADIYADRAACAVVFHVCEEASADDEPQARRLARAACPYRIQIEISGIAEISEANPSTTRQTKATRTLTEKVPIAERASPANITKSISCIGSFIMLSNARNLRSRRSRV